MIGIGHEAICILVTFGHGVLGLWWYLDSDIVFGTKCGTAFFFELLEPAVGGLLTPFPVDYTTLWQVM